MSPKKPKFPLQIKQGSVIGSVIVKIYRSINKGRASFTVAHYLGGKRNLQMFFDFEEAHAEAKSIANKLAQGDLDVLHLKNADKVAYVRAFEAVRPSGVPLELAAIEYAEATKALNGIGTLLGAAQDYAQRHLQGASNRTVAEAELCRLRGRKRIRPGDLQNF